MENKKISKQINNIVADNIEKLKTVFPNVVKDGIVDFKALELELREIKEEETEQKEKYDFTWAGKTKAKKKAQEDIYCKTLNYIEGDGKDEDTTQNLYIEGDNLEVLKLLRQNYYGAIKMIYIDPPYNTGNDFIYNDNFIENSVESDIKEGIRNEEGDRLEQNGKSSNNKYHGKWLTMMYPRLKIARDLLTEDGVIFISIDDREVHNLRKICDEIFGEFNFIAQICHKNRDGVSNDKIISSNHNHILFYCRNYDKIHSIRENYGITRDESDFKTYNKDDNDGKGAYTLNPVTGPGGASKGNPYYEILGVTNYWRFGKERMEKMINEGKVIKVNNNLYQKTYKKDMINKKKGATTWWDSVGTTSKGTNQLKQLFEMTIFDFAKPIDLIIYILKFIDYSKNDIILDFFSGSATTAHAVMQLNGEDGGNRKYIMVQIPQLCDEKTEAYKNGYKNICEIGKERIRRAGEKIKEEIEQYNTQLKLDEEPKKIPDIGFKVFRVANTNIKWNNIQNDGQLDINTLKGTPDQIDFILNAKDKDIVYEIMLRQKNIPLTSKIILLDNIGNRTYLYANLYLICLEMDITDELIEKLSQINPLPRKFIFRDSAFGEDCNRKEKTFRLLDNLIKKNYGEDTYNIEFI